MIDLLSEFLRYRPELESRLGHRLYLALLTYWSAAILVRVVLWTY